MNLNPEASKMFLAAETEKQQLLAQAREREIRQQGIMVGAGIASGVHYTWAQIEGGIVQLTETEAPAKLEAVSAVA